MADTIPVVLLVAATALAFTSAVAAAVSLWFHSKTGSVRELESMVKSTQLDLHELFDTVEKWTRRDRVRRLREGREAMDTPAQIFPIPMDRKAALRQRSNGSLMGSSTPT